MIPTQVKKVLLVCCGQGFNREYQGHYNRYKVLLDGVPIERIYNKEELNKLPYWVNRSRVMAMTVWGMSQEFEATINLGQFLGWHKATMSWIDYCRLLKEKIEVVY